MKANKILILCIPILVILILLFICGLYPILNPHIKKISTLNSFEKDSESMKIIAQEWEDLSYTYMFTDRTQCEMGVIDVGYEPSSNITIDTSKNYFEYLLVEKKYKYIMKHDNAVYFTKYSSLGNGYGIAFSMDGEKPQNEFIISSEKINDFDGWYFYVMR